MEQDVWKKGFVQYQFVLPLEAKQGLIDILRISEAGMGSFLTVLKVFGKQDSIISFPKEGYTLAMDFAVRDGLMEFLDKLDEIVLKNGGRLYMSKDARMKPAALGSGYPKLEEFKSIVKKYNGQNKFCSVQSDQAIVDEKLITECPLFLFLAPVPTWLSPLQENLLPQDIRFNSLHESLINCCRFNLIYKSGTKWIAAFISLML